jgi:sugar lactone lactonase YvrE
LTIEINTGKVKLLRYNPSPNTFTLLDDTVTCTGFTMANSIVWNKDGTYAIALENNKVCFISFDSSINKIYLEGVKTNSISGNKFAK